MVVGISMVKDEADILPHTIPRMRKQVDLVLVADNGSTDGTRDLLRNLSAVVVDDPDPAHYQSRKMSELARRAFKMGADWVVPFDADEVWLATDGRRVADVLMDCTAHWAPATLYHHLATPEVGLSPWMVREASVLPKMACRPALSVTIAEGNHKVSYPQPIEQEGLLEVHHFPYRSAKQMISKVRNGAKALALTDLSFEVGKHWREYGELTDEQITEAFYEHFYIDNPEIEPNLVHRPC